MATFTRLPAELRSHIYALARPNFISITIKERADLTITSVSAPPALLTTTKESRAEAQKWDLKPYSILVGDDYQNFLFSGDIPLHVVITPSSAEHLSITWTELYTVIGDALLDAQKLVIQCSQPARLARLFMLPEAEFVGVGSSCVEKGLFGGEIICSDREAREALRPDIRVCVGAEEYVLQEERVGVFFGGEGFVTKGFTTASAQLAHRTDCDEAFVMVEPNAGAQCSQDAEVELQLMEKGSEELTESAMERFCAEMEKLFPKTACAVKSDPGGSVMPKFD